ncbi:hypothetical protein GCM10023347_07940 [Streptomyces chumphonensis]|uniref:Uncharacterized protein n=1 Tax=Streptomyces chumphonensis TaxID=1214925 RepID=A0A927F618_9ACTN|nr:hypothetical protein [Streptomyces chumphonensis]MBD3934956.1 hypothetical protein [Streptomyces chumphonensis]
MQHAPGRAPRLADLRQDPGRWPAFPEDLTVRNVATHTRDELTEQEGMEQLAAYSYFARLLDQCEVRRAEEPDGT